MRTNLTIPELVPDPTQANVLVRTIEHVPLEVELLIALRLRTLTSVAIPVDDPELVQVMFLFLAIEHNPELVLLVTAANDRFLTSDAVPELVELLTHVNSLILE